ncbi:hypothetical protein [Chitinolyticbacter meiyuanensis]|uniref:hypothetical protein n=1 Tax=Chitinolyticbacter meiyuanensis TaxID=682798 RepID=UPI0011E5D3E3|nr:hypothetical protein [Chitinolyticbacter meiyuanensis]
MGEPGKIGGWLDASTKGISLFSLAIAAYAAWRALPLDQEVKRLSQVAEEQRQRTVELDNQLKQANAELQRAESERKLTLELYKEVQAVLALDRKDPRREDAVRVLVESLADDPFRWKLLQALAVGASSEDVQRKAGTTASFYRDEAVNAVAPATSTAPAESGQAYGSYNVDFFHCERGGEATRTAANAALSLRPAGSTARWRPRLLPDEINLQPGYRISGRLIRYNPDEADAAKRLAAALAKQGQPFQLMQIGYPTPRYLSVFFC